jgi:hypothetical protein
MREHKPNANMDFEGATAMPVTGDLRVARFVVAIEQLSDTERLQLLVLLSNRCNVTSLTVEVSTASKNQGPGGYEDELTDIGQRAKEGDAFAVEMLTQLMYASDGEAKFLNRIHSRPN